MTQKSFQAVVTSKEIANGEVVICGRELTYLMYKKIVPKFYSKNGEIGDTNGKICKYLTEKAFSGVENLEIKGTENLTYPITNFWRNVANPLSDVVYDLCAKDDSGFKMTADLKNKKWVIEFYKGRETDTVLSEGLKNAYDVTYKYDLDDYFSVGHFYRNYDDEGTWNPYKNDPRLSSPDPSNFGKKYSVIKQSYSQFGTLFEVGGYAVCDNREGVLKFDEDPTGFWTSLENGEGVSGIYKWEGRIDADNDLDGEKELEKHAPDTNINLKTIGVEYLKDYLLGDNITVKYEKNGLNFMKKVRVKSVRIFEDYYEKGERPSFREID